MSSEEQIVEATGTPARGTFLRRLRGELVRATNGHAITAADAWDILREWDAAVPPASVPSPPEPARDYETPEAELDTYDGPGDWLEPEQSSPGQAG